MKNKPGPAVKPAGKEMDMDYLGFTKKYLVHTGSGNGRGKTYFFDTLDEAITKAKELQKRRKDNNPSLIIEGELSENGFWSYYVRNRIEY